MRIGAAVTYRAIAGSALLGESLAVLRDPLGAPGQPTGAQPEHHRRSSARRGRATSDAHAADGARRPCPCLGPRGRAWSPSPTSCWPSGGRCSRPTSCWSRSRSRWCRPPAGWGFEGGSAPAGGTHGQRWRRGSGRSLTTVVIGAVGAQAIRLEAAGPYDAAWPARPGSALRRSPTSPNWPGPGTAPRSRLTLAGRLLGRLRTQGRDRADG